MAGENVLIYIAFGVFDLDWLSFGTAQSVLFSGTENGLYIINIINVGFGTLFLLDFKRFFTESY